MYDYLIVGAGYSGSVFAERIASQLNKKVLIVDKRNHIAGNAYDFYNEDGILIHKYGPHCFIQIIKKYLIIYLNSQIGIFIYIKSNHVLTETYILSLLTGIH